MDRHQLNEAETRAEHIDPALKAAGWGVVEGSRVRREFITPGRLEGFGKRAKAEIADYVLVYRNHKLAVVEAKAWDKHYTGGLAQAKAYAAKLGARFGYSTNGQAIYEVDMVKGTEGKQQVFLDFVLSHYVSVGVEELDQEKLTPLLRLKYHGSIADAVADLGRPDEIGRAFVEFQKYLYEKAA